MKIKDKDIRDIVKPEDLKKIGKKAVAKLKNVIC